MGRAPCCEKVGLKRGRWTAEEDEKLANYIATHGEGSWRSLPKNAGLLRCGKSCRLRWVNYLKADLKRGNITEKEEELIFKLHATVGNRWSLIATHLEGRTDNEIKNYWNSHLSRRVHSFRKTSNEEKESIVTLVLDKVPGKGRRKSRGRTPRSLMKKKSNSSNVTIDSSLSISLVQSEQGSNTLMLQTEPMGPGPAQDGPTSQIVDSALWGASEESVGDEVLMMMGTCEEQREGLDGNLLQLGQEEGGVGPMGSAQLEWDLEGIEAQLWGSDGNGNGDGDGDGDGEGGEMWPWLEGCGQSQQIESLANWLLSDVL